MAYTYEQLSKMTVAQLRDIAHTTQHDAVRAAGTMHKEKLLPALCIALGIEGHVHHEVKGIDKRAVKSEIKQLKLKKQSALEANNYDEFIASIRRIHDWKHKLRKSIV